MTVVDIVTADQACWRMISAQPDLDIQKATFESKALITIYPYGSPVKMFLLAALLVPRNGGLSAFAMHGMSGFAVVLSNLSLFVFTCLNAPLGRGQIQVVSRTRDCGSTPHIRCLDDETGGDSTAPSSETLLLAAGSERYPPSGSTMEARER